MKDAINRIYKTSDDVISKNVEGQYILVPLISGVGNLDDEIFQLNATGSVIWEMLDGKKTLVSIIDDLSKDYGASYETIEKDVIHLVEKLLQRNFIFKVK